MASRIRIFTGQKPDEGWSNLDVAVWTAVVLFFVAFVLVLLQAA